MKKNGYLRRFLALFLTFVMLMADSSVTTFAATVGRVQRYSAQEENNESQCSVQINADPEFDFAAFRQNYGYVMLGVDVSSWYGVEPKSSIEQINDDGSATLSDVSEDSDLKLCFVKGTQQYQWYGSLSDGDTVTQGENKFRISVSKDAGSWTVNIIKVQTNIYNVQINAGEGLDFAKFIDEYQYAFLGKETSSGIKNVSDIVRIDSESRSVVLNVDDYKDEADLKLYFVKSPYNWNWILSVGSKYEQGDTNFKINVVTDAGNTLNVNLDKVQLIAHNVRISVADSFDFEKFTKEYKYVVLGKESASGIEAISKNYESISPNNKDIILNVEEDEEATDLKLYFVKNINDWNNCLSENSNVKQGDIKYKFTINRENNDFNVNVEEAMLQKSIEISGAEDFDFTAFANEYKYAMLGKINSSKIDKISTIEPLDATSNNFVLRIEEGISTTDASLYFVKRKDEGAWNEGLKDGSEFKQGNYKFKVTVTTDANNPNNLKVEMQKVEFKPGKSVDYRSVLGNALHFGIVANDFTCKGDLEANLAVGTLHGSGNMKSSKNNGGNGTTLIGDYKDSGWFTEKNGEGGQGDLIIYTTAEAAKNFNFNIWSKGLEIDTETYTKEELQEIVQNMVSEAETTSTQLVTNGQAQGLKYSEAVDESGVIDLMGSPDGTYYINFENGEFAGKKLRFKLTEGQNVVLNIPDASVSLNQYNFKLNGQNYWSDGGNGNGIGEKACEKIIYNLYNATSVETNLINGTIIAPKGQVENVGVSAGWIVANSVISGDTEWHCLSKDIPIVTSYALKAKKTVNGKSPSRSETNKFSFNLYKIDEDGNETLVDTKSNGDGGLVMFDTFGNITQTGTYWYKIEEADGTAGYTTDSTVYYAEVVVKAVSSNGVLISKNATVTYHRGSQDGAQVTVPSFNNIKKKDETSANINVKKTFTNGAVNKTFEFKLTASEDAPMPADAENGEKVINVSQNDGVQSFGEIKYTKAGTYTYQITENASLQEEGIDYDGSIWTVVVEVPVDFSTPTVTYSKDGNTTSAIAAEFVNSSEEQKGSLKIVKAAGDDTDLDGEAFYFKVTDSQENVVKNGDSDVWSITYDKENAENSISIDNLEPGTYTIAETDATGKTAVTGKDFPYIVAGANSVRVVAGTPTDVIITNTKYEATGSLVLSATKELIGKDLEANAYSFILLNEAGIIQQTKKNDANGIITFDPINYSLDDAGKDFTYTVKEVKGSEAGVTYDRSEYTVVAKVRDNGTGHLVVTTEMTKTTKTAEGTETTDAANAIVFNNKYEATGSLDLTATKELSGKTLEAGKYSFVVKDSANNVLRTATNAQNGEVTFDPINYTLEDDGNTYTYYVSEVKGTEAGVTYDETVYSVTVTISDKGDGTLKVEKTIENNGTSVSAMTFQNKYTATGSLELSATKELSGKDLEADEYSFHLLDKDGAVLQTKTNATDGSVTFDPIAYNLEDAGKDFTYTVEEVKGSEAGVAYDSSKYTVVAKVRDNDKNGNLTVTTEVTKTTKTEAGSQTEPANAIVFNNKYEATGNLDLTATKELSGKTLEAGKYSFVVKDGANNVLRTATNAQNGDVTFDPINYTIDDAGKTYTYYVSEVKGAEAGVTYDEAVYTVTVTISDNGNGTLKVEKVIENDGTSVSAMTFQNKYTATGSLELSATKELSGKDLEADAYSFHLLDKDGAVLQTKTNAADGSVTFDPIAYNLEDAGKDFTYTVEEVKGNEAGVAYDSSKYTVVAKVRDNDKNGNLTVTTEVTKMTEPEKGTQTEPANAIVFNNKYEATGSLDLTATKNLSGKTLEAGKYSFVVKDSANNVLRTATNAQNGDVTFDPINYTLEDDGESYTYYVSEVKGTEAGVTYDETVYTVTVEISDNGNGTLNVEKTIEADGAPVEGMTFQNEYTAAGSLDLVASKQLIGREFQAGDDWTFTVTSDTNAAPMPERTSVTTDATSGNTDELNFGTINYTLKDAGKTYVYTITESGNVDGVTNDPELIRTVTVTISDNHDGSLNIEKVVKKGDSIESGIVFYNEYETTDIAGTKTWNDNDNESGKRPTSITVNLLANGTKIASKEVTAANGWSYSFDNLPVYKNKNKVVYTVTEEAVTDYTPVYDGTNIENRYTPGETSATVMKVWNDADNQDGKRPTSITVSLLANEEPTGKTVTLSADNNWQATISGLQEKANGQPIEYTWSEDVPAGYELTTNKTEGKVTTLTNTHTPETTDIAGTKTWNDNDNENGNRPDSITVNLLADGVKVDSRIVTADNNWAYSFKDLPVYKDQKQITYTVSEEAVTGYQSSITNYDITNTEVITKVEGSKTWSDNDNKDGNRPTSITVNLLANGIKIASKEVSEADNWSYSFDNLPVYKNKNKVVYTVTEEAVTDYTPVYDGTNIENRYTPGETSATVMKVWNDADNQDGKRPTSITVSLLANEEPTGKTVTLSADNNWQDTINGLQEKANGQLIEYTWSEDVPAGYELTTNKTEGKVTTLTNTHTPETTDIAGTKIWNDNDNENGNRPESITVNLLADGVVIDSKVVKATDNWSYSFKDLPVYKDQKQIVYTVSEEAVTGYQSSVTNYDITNTEVITKVEGSKTWSDNDNKDGNRPTSITVNLLANGTKIASKEVTAANGWSYSFDNLPVYKNKNKVVYTVTEEAVTDYTPVYDGTNIENRYTPGETSATVMKVWNDADNQDGKRPTSITVSLLANEEPTGKTVTLSADNNWQASISGLQEKANGQLIEYTWSEDVPAGYELTTNKTEGKVTTLTNTHTPETTDIAGTKTWNDNDNENGNRPDSITVNLLADGVKVDSQTVTADNNWAYSFKDLPVYKDQKQIVYTVSEEAVNGYQSSVTNYDITNTEVITKVEGSKTWSDNDNKDGNRPTSITVNLLANGTKIASKEVTAANGWSYSFDNLPVYKNKVKVVYTVTEEPVADYTPVYDGTNIENRYTPGETSATVMKVWDDADNQDGKRPTSITVSLLANEDPTGKTVTLNADNNWQATISGLQEKANGQLIEYTWSEDVPAGYELTTNKTEGKVTTLTNTHTPETTDIAGTKTWNDNDNENGNRPDSITVNLLADGVKVDSQTVTADNNWAYSFKGLPVYKDQKQIVYTVSEEAVTGYQSSVTNYDITNTEVITKVEGSKIWSDNGNKDGNRPTSITVNLLANGTKIASKEVSEADNWSYSFDNLPVYKNKNKVVYTVTEEAVTDYTPVYDGTNIENRYTPGETSATVMKVWDDADNQDGKRPTSITVSLLANEEPTGKTVTLSADNNWQATISGLQEKANGQLIEYTWSEDVPAGYELTTNKTEGQLTTLTNTHTPETTDIAGTKTWNDNDNENGNRPDSITVNLLADGLKVDSQTVTADNNWAYSFKDLPVYKDQKQIVYTVSEEAVTGYQSSVTDYNITNTEETTKVEGTKTWSDSDNQDGKRPTSITVNLLANGEKVAEQTVTADTNWTYTFENLPVYKDQKQITYTISEEPVADYTTEYDGYNITNSYTPGKTSATITKIWSDAENQDGNRPENITVSLLADGEATGTTVTLNADNNWTETVTDLPEKANGQAIEYTWTEENVPEGYQLTENNTVGTVTTLTNTYTPETTSVTGTKTWSDNNQTAKRPLSITIRLFANGTEKASQTVTAGEDGTWTYSFNDLPKYEAGKEIAYTVSEDPVSGYVTSTDGYNITNTITAVKVSKVDVADGKELAGAHIQILDQDGNVVEEWDSTGEAHEVTGLKTGAKYTLRETVAPDGYALTSDTTFVLKEDGTVDKDNTSTTISQEGVLLVEDSLATSPSIAVTKKLTYIGENLTARDQTFYVALYSDEACTQRVSDVKAIEFKNADSSTVTFTDNIEAKKTYYIGECTADGTAQSSGTLADGTLYAANFNEGNSAIVEEANGTTTVTFENVFSSFPDGFYKQGQLTVTKKLLGADGDTKNSSKVFYAGIFDDADYTQLSTRVDRNIVALDLGGGNEVSENVNVGLEENGEVTLYVTETDVNGNPVAGSEGFGYKVSVSADSVTFDMNNLAASVVITNQEETNETITPTPTETPSNGGDENNGETPSENHGGSSTKSPKTGDNTPVEMYLVLLLAAAMLVAETERRRRKSKRQ